MENTVTSYSSGPVAPSEKKKTPVLLIAIIVIIAAIVGGYFLYKQSKKSTKPTVSVTPTEEPSPTITPAQVDKKSVKIQVLNGTGTPGQAASAVNALVKAGYSADNIKTDNASDSNHSSTTIQAKSGFEATANDIKTALSSLFDNVSVDSTPLGSDSQFDIVVTTGGKKYEAPTKAPAPTSSQTASPTPSSTTPTDTPIPTSASTPTPSQ